MGVVGDLLCSYYYGQGRAKLNKGKVPQAAYSFEKMLEVERKNDDDLNIALAYRSLAKIYRSNKMKKEARTAANEILKILSKYDVMSDGFVEAKEEAELILRDSDQ
jgi:tetratricopeptide (TPR) repeat protein